jgi:hypothetical protein
MPDIPKGKAGEVKCYRVPHVTAQGGLVNLLRKPKQLEIDLAKAKAAGCNVDCKYTVAEAEALDENDPALFFAAILPRGIEHLLMQLTFMAEGYSSMERDATYRYGWVLAHGTVIHSAAKALIYIISGQAATTALHVLQLRQREDKGVPASQI